MSNRDRKITQEQFIQVLEIIASSNLGSTYACKEVGVSENEFRMKIVKEKEAADLYFEYKRKQAAAMTEQIETEVRDIETYVSCAGTRRAEASMIAVANLRVNTYKWILERLKPDLFDSKAYSNKDLDDKLTPEIIQQYQELKDKYKSEY